MRILGRLRGRDHSWADTGGIPLQSRFQLGGWRKATGFGSVGLRLLSIRPWTPQSDCRSDAWRRQVPDGSQGDRCLESFLALASAEALFAGLEPVLMEWRREKAKTKNRRAEPCGCFALHDVLWCRVSLENITQYIEIVE